MSQGQEQRLADDGTPEGLCLGCFKDEHDGPCKELTKEEAARIPSGHGFGMTTDGLHEYWPGIPCQYCGKFVGRDGYIGIEHFEMSSEVASVEGECRRCIESDKCAECHYPIKQVNGVWRHVGSHWRHEARPEAA